MGLPICQVNFNMLYVYSFKFQDNSVTYVLVLSPFYRW